MEYKTKGVCSMAIQYDLDDEQKACRLRKLSHVWRESSAAADQLHVQTSLQQL